MKTSTILAAVTAFLATAAWGCIASEKSSNPLRPSVAGPIPGVNITSPTPVEPRDGVRIPVHQQPVTLMLENASSTGVRPLSYTFQVATDAGFVNKVFVREGVAPGEGRTTLRLPDALASDHAYYWRAQALDGANTGPESAPAHFSIVTPVVIDKPTPQAPVNNVKLVGLRPEFLFSNAPRSGPVGTIRYTLEVAGSDSFGDKVAIWAFDEQPSLTRFEAPHDLVGDTQYFWHVRAYDGTTTGPWSDTQVFQTGASATAPGPGSGSGTPCQQNQPFGIVQCRRAQHSAFMSRGEIVVFLREVARDLNAIGFSEGPMGLLEKSTGNNCEGYSCDLLCSPSNVWDVLLDSESSQVPAWRSLDGPPPNTCEIQ